MPIIWPGEEDVYHSFRKAAAVFFAAAIHQELGYHTMAVDNVQELLWLSPARPA